VHGGDARVAERRLGEGEAKRLAAVGRAVDAGDEVPVDLRPRDDAVAGVRVRERLPQLVVRVAERREVVE
jgi:hypothetical protein